LLFFEAGAVMFQSVPPICLFFRLREFIFRPRHVPLMSTSLFFLLLRLHVPR